MNNRFIIFITLIAISGLFPVPGWSETGAPAAKLESRGNGSTIDSLSAEEILRRVDERQHPRSFELFFQVVNRRPNGRKNSITVYSVQSGDDRAAAVIVSPKEMRGRAVLRRGKKIWKHVPGELKPRPGHLRQSLPGGVFNNADILTVNLLADYEPVILKREDRDIWLQLTARHGAMPYEKMHLLVDGRTFIPITLVQFGPKNVAMKTIHFTKAGPFGGNHVRSREMHTVSGMNKRYASTIRLGWMKERSFSDEAFSIEFLPKLGVLLK